VNLVSAETQETGDKAFPAQYGWVAPYGGPS